VFGGALDDLEITGDADAVTSLFGLLDDFPFWFPISTP
jgi:alkyl sulfatase BDS1-like metallo-beta-lactamase superfamily hydrolase